METGWEAVDGKRQLARYIQWEPSPDKPILKDRSGRLPARTPVAFTERDYLGLLEPLEAAQKALSGSDVLQELDTDVAVEPEPVEKGGPVGTGVAKTATAKKAAAKKAAPPATPVAQRPVAPVPAAVPSVRPPSPIEDPVTEGEAVHNVKTILGGEVINPETGAAPVDTPEPAHQVEAQATQVLEFDADDPSSEPTVGTLITCGSPRYDGATPVAAATGCGQELHLQFTDDRVTGCTSPEGQMPDLIQIAGLKTRAFLCNPCYAAYRNASKK